MRLVNFGKFVSIWRALDAQATTAGGWWAMFLAGSKLLFRFGPFVFWRKVARLFGVVRRSPDMVVGPTGFSINLDGLDPSKVGLDKWFGMIKDSYLSPPVLFRGANLPSFPSDFIQSNTTGQCGLPTISEAFVFYRDCVSTFAELGCAIQEKDRVLDFGVGWGRIARFFLRDVPLENIYGIDVTSEYIDICRNTFESSNFTACQPFPPTDLPSDYFNFIVAYSVFSHLSEEACMKWMKEFSRVLTPGGIVAVTTRGRPFFDYCESQKPSGVHLVGSKSASPYMSALGNLFDDFNIARNRYDKGEFVHSNGQGVTGGGAMDSSFYGETFIPEEYAKTAYSSFLDFERFVFDPRYQSHPIIFFRKKTE
jgi:2-polyprenyl-3-methyl-5-hydroxy-6-metoxy-1,4-benzoquinol methylase